MWRGRYGTRRSPGKRVLPGAPVNAVAAVRGSDAHAELEGHVADRLVAHDGAGARGVQHLAVARVETDVVQVAVEEHEVADLELALRVDAGPGVRLRLRGAGQRDPGLPVGPGGEARAVVGAGARGAEDVRLAELRLGGGERRARHARALAGVGDGAGGRSERGALAGAVGAVLLRLHRGLLGGRHRVEDALRLGELGLDLALLLAQFLARVGEVGELVGGLLALLGELALLGLDLLELLRLLRAQLVEGTGLLEEGVRVGGEEELHGGVDAAGPVLGGGDGAERLPLLVQLVLAARHLVLDGVDLLLQLLLLLRGPVELLGRLLRFVVELVDLRLHLGLGRLGVCVRGLRSEGHGSSGGRGEHGHAGAARLLRSTVGRHEGELLLPPAAYRSTGGRCPLTATPDG
ncbi:putative NLP/P60-family protein [Streptomyces sp. Tu6071]|nr:putative NLP/P60-family protein [Streptomyces sp. Tu6071]